MNWLTNLFKPKATPLAGVVEPEINSCSCDTEMKFSVCVYPKGWTTTGQAPVLKNLCKKCITDLCNEGSFVVFL